MLYTPTLCTLEAIRRRSDIVDTGDDALIKSFIRAASDIVQQYTARTFVPYTDTREYVAPSKGRILHVDEDLLSVTSITDGSGALAANTYSLTPWNKSPKNAVVLEPTYFWTRQTDTWQDVAIAGVWGYHRNPSKMWRSVAVLEDALASTTATTLTITGTAAAAGIEVYDYIRIGSEVMQVTAASTAANAVLTVVRGDQGSTAATALDGATVELFNVTSDVREAAEQLTVYLYRQRDKAGEQNIQFADGAVLVDQQSAATILRVLDPYRRLEPWLV